MGGRNKCHVRVPGGGKASPVTQGWSQTATEGWAVRQDGRYEQRGASEGPEAGRNTVRFALSKEADDSEGGPGEGMQVGGKAGCTGGNDARRGHLGSRIECLGTDYRWGAIKKTGKLRETSRFFYPLVLS